MRVGHLVPTPGGEYCDFCTSGPVFKLYECSNFVFNNMPIFQKDSGVWAACARCAELVDSENWTNLTKRAVRKFAKRHGPVPKYEAVRLREQLQQVHQLFREHRTKPSIN